ncbi:Chaperone protein ClpB1 [Raphanus sativus]|nr:Chaperone protein ClpB1 [Raphanus sativus]
MNQRRYQKDSTFKYKLKKPRQHFYDKVFTEKEDLQVVVSDNINAGFGWDTFGGCHVELVSVCATGENMMLAENVGTKNVAQVLSRWTVIPVTSLFQPEKERLTALAVRIHMRDVCDKAYETKERAEGN